MKIKCLKCGDIVEGDKKGHLITCKCGKCYIDETPYYYRIGAEDIKQVEEIKEDKGNHIPRID